MKKVLFTLFALIALVGCKKEQISMLSQLGKNVFTVEAASYENAINDAPTKSKYFDEASQKITNLNVWVYISSTGALANTGTIPGTSVSYKTYFENQTQLDGDLLFPDFDETYDIYIFTNVGQKTPPANKAAADAFKYTFTSYDSFSSNGFPMAAHYKFRPSDPSVSHSLLATRLVSKYTVTFDFKGDNNYKFILKSATVKQSANVITPFIADSKASSSTEVFASADELDVSKLTVAAGQDLYMLENVQGTVFSSGAERSEKNIAYQAKPVTSFLEFVGELDKNDGTGYNKVTCRYYFGSGTYAGVKRNFNIPLTLTMSNSILNHDEWIVTPEEPYNTGYIVFSPSSLSIVGDGNWNAFSAQPYSAEGINDNVKYTLSYNASDFSAAGLTLQYRKGSSGSWTNYSGQELTGKYNFQVKSSYSGSTQKTVKIYSLLAEQQGEYFVIYLSNPGNDIWLVDEGDYQISWYDFDGQRYDKSFNEITSGCYYNEPMNDQAKIVLQDVSINLQGTYRDKYDGQNATIYFYACNSSIDAIKYFEGVPYAVDMNKCWSGSSTDSIGDGISTITLDNAYGAAEDFYVGIKVVFEDGHIFWAKLDEIPSGTSYPGTKYNKRLIDGVDCYMINIYNNTEVITSIYTEKTPVYNTETVDVYLYVDTETATVCYNAGVFGNQIPAYTLKDNLGYSYNIPGYISSNKTMSLMQLSETAPAGSLSKHFYWEYGKITGCREGNEIMGGKIYLEPIEHTDYWHATTKFLTPYWKEKEDYEHVYYKRYEVRIDH